VKAVALLLVALVAGCSHPDACERAAGGFTAGFVKYANPNPSIETTANRLAERLEPVLVERCRDDGWPAEALRCDEDGHCLMQALSSQQRDKLKAAIAKVIDDARRDLPQ
jgi:hypothetical protein